MVRALRQNWLKQFPAWKMCMASGDGVWAQSEWRMHSANMYVFVIEITRVIFKCTFSLQRSLPFSRVLCMLRHLNAPPATLRQMKALSFRTFLPLEASRFSLERWKFNVMLNMTNHCVLDCACLRCLNAAVISGSNTRSYYSLRLRPLFNNKRSFVGNYFYR